MGWHHVASSANGGSKEFCNRGREDRNKLPLYLIEYHGDNFIYKKDNSPRLTEITLKEIIVNKEAEKREDRLTWKVHYVGHPTLEQLKEEIKKLPQ